MSNTLRITFLAHMIVALVFGAALWLMPGRSLALLGWVPEQVQLPQSDLTVSGMTFVDPVLTRLLGASLLALGFASFLGWRARQGEQVKALVQMEFVFCVLGVAAILAGMTLGHTMPVLGWLVLALLAVFGAAWGLALRR